MGLWNQAKWKSWLTLESPIWLATELVTNMNDWRVNHLTVASRDLLGADAPRFHVSRSNVMTSPLEWRATVSKTRAKACRQIETRTTWNTDATQLCKPDMTSGLPGPVTSCDTLLLAKQRCASLHRSAPAFEACNNETANIRRFVAWKMTSFQMSRRLSHPVLKHTIWQIPGKCECDVTCDCVLQFCAGLAKILWTCWSCNNVTILPGFSCSQNKDKTATDQRQSVDHFSFSWSQLEMGAWENLQQTKIPTFTYVTTSAKGSKTVAGHGSCFEG